MKIFAVGHSTFKLETNDLVLLTDPWFATSGLFYYMLTRRIYPLAVEADAIGRCDAMLVSHNHVDHLSDHAFNLSRKHGALIVGPKGVIRRAKRHGISSCQELQPGTTVDLKGIRITAVPAIHPLSRRPVGFFIEGEKNIYFSGDTRFDWRIVNALRGKRIDVAILQTSCTFYSLLGGADGMDINYAHELARALMPGCVIPMHFDCVGKYLDLVMKQRVTEHSLDVEDALNKFKARLFADGIDCRLLFAGNEAEF